MDWLKGKKTYLLSIAAGIATTLHAMGVLDAATYATVMGLLAPAGLMALRAAK